MRCELLGVIPARGSVTHYCSSGTYLLDVSHVQDRKSSKTLLEVIPIDAVTHPLYSLCLIASDNQRFGDREKHKIEISAFLSERLQARRKIVLDRDQLKNQKMKKQAFQIKDISSQIMTFVPLLPTFFLSQTSIPFVRRYLSFSLHAN